MSARTSEKKRNAFLRAFAATGNQALAAEQAGISKKTVHNLRKADAAFDSAWRAAKAESAGRLGAAGSNRPPRGWERRGATMLVVRRPGKRPPQVARSAGNSVWTPWMEDRFLGRLRRSNNARLACREAGVTASSYEAHWRRWPDFRRRVREARAFARLWLEAIPERPFELDLEAADAIAPPSVAEALRLVRRWRQG